MAVVRSGRNSRKRWLPAPSLRDFLVSEAATHLAGRAAPSPGRRGGGLSWPRGD